MQEPAPAPLLLAITLLPASLAEQRVLNCLGMAGWKAKSKGLGIWGIEWDFDRLEGAGRPRKWEQ